MNYKLIAVCLLCAATFVVVSRELDKIMTVFEEQHTLHKDIGTYLVSHAYAIQQLQGLTAQLHYELRGKLTGDVI